MGSTAQNKAHKSITIDIPAGVDVTEHEAKMILACHLFDTGVLSSGQAAEMVGLSKWDFIMQMGKYGASLFHLTADDLDAEIANARPR